MSAPYDVVNTSKLTDQDLKEHVLFDLENQTDIIYFIFKHNPKTKSVDIIACRRDGARNCTDQFREPNRFRRELFETIKNQRTICIAFSPQELSRMKPRLREKGIYEKFLNHLIGVQYYLVDREQLQGSQPAHCVVKCYLADSTGDIPLEKQDVEILFDAYHNMPSNITVRVLDKLTEKPVPNAVLAVDFDGVKQEEEKTTDKHGFRKVHIADAERTITLVAKEEDKDGQAISEGATVVNLDTLQSYEPIVLLKRTEITVEVTDPYSTPIPEVTVKMEEKSKITNEAGRTSLDFPFELETDTQLTISKPDYLPSEYASTVVKSVLRQHIHAVLIPPKREFVLRVTDQAGRSLPGIAIVRKDAPLDQAEAQPITSANGKAHLVLSGREQYVLEFYNGARKIGEWRIRNSDSTHEIPVRLNPSNETRKE